jgi:hypothetical protein
MNLKTWIFDSSPSRASASLPNLPKRGRNGPRCERSLAKFAPKQHALASLLGKVSDAVTEIAKVQERHSEILGKLVEIQANQGARLNVIEGRLAIIEKHTGLVKA